MSSTFFKKIFKNTILSEKETTQHASSNNNSNNNVINSDDFTHSIENKQQIQDVSFSDDEVSAKLKESWNAFKMDESSGEFADDTFSNKKDLLQQIEELLEKCALKTIACVDHQSAKETTAESSVSLSTPSQRLFRPIKGLPFEFIVDITNILYDLIVIGSAVLSPSSISVGSGNIGSDAVASNSWLQEKIPKITKVQFLQVTNQHQRQQQVQALRCISILTYWRHNRAIMWSKFKNDFAQVLVGTLVTLTSNLHELRPVATSGHQVFQQFSERIQCAMDVVTIFCMFSSSCDFAKLKFNLSPQRNSSRFSNMATTADYIQFPCLPWNIATWDKFSAISSQMHLVNESFDVLCNHISSRYSSFEHLNHLNTHRFFSTDHPLETSDEPRPAIKSFDADIMFSTALKNGGIHTVCVYLIDSLRNLMDHFMAITIELEDIKSSSDHKTSSSATTTESTSQIASRQFITCMVLQIQSLYLLNESISTDEDVENMIECEFDTVFSCILSNFISLDYEVRLRNMCTLSTESEEMLMSLILKRGLLILQINETIRFRSMHKKNAQLINIELIATFIAWISTYYNRVHLEANSVLLSSLHNLYFSIDCYQDLNQIVEFRDADMFGKRKTSNRHPHIDLSYHLSRSSLLRSSDHQDMNNVNAKCHEWVYQIHGSALWACFYDSFLQSYFNANGSKGYNPAFEQCVQFVVKLTLQLLESNQNNAHLQPKDPLCQYYFVKFLSVCFQLYPETTVLIMRKNDLWQHLFGVHFMFLEVFSSKLPETELNIHMDVVPEKDNVRKLLWTHQSKNSFGDGEVMTQMLSYALKDHILDFAAKAIEFSFGVSVEASPFEEILLINQAVNVHAMSADLSSQLACYQIFKWLKHVYLENAEIILSSGNAVFRNRCISLCFDMTSRHMDVLRARRHLQSTNDPMFAEVTWSVRSIIIDFLLLLFSEVSFHTSPEWLELFYITVADGGSEDILREEVSSGLSPPSRDIERTKLDFNENSAGKTRVKLLETLLLDSRCQSVAANLLTRIISTCGRELRSMKDKNIERNYSASIKILAVYITERLVEIARLTILFPKGTDSYQIAFICLNSLTEILQSHTFDSIIQDFFRKSDSMTIVLQSLMGLNNTQSGNFSPRVKGLTHKILHQGLRLLMSLMISNNAMKALFAGLMIIESDSLESQAFSKSMNLLVKKKKSKTPSVNIKSFCAMIRDVEKGQISEDTLDIFVEMLVDQRLQRSRSDTHFSYNDSPKLHNETALAILINLIPFCGHSMQVYIVTTLKNFFMNRSALANLSFCSKAQFPLLDLILDLFPVVDDSVHELLVPVLQILGKYNISVSQMKHMFRVMQHAGEVRPGYNWRILQALQGMIRESTGPRHTFVMNGQNSGIQLQSPILSWPARKGFAVSLWFKIQHFGGDDLSTFQDNTSEPHLVSFRGQSNSGFDIFLKKVEAASFVIVVRSFLENGKYADSISSDTFQVFATIHNWHFLMVSFKPSSFRSRSEMSLVFDNHFHQQSFQYPSLNDFIPMGCIGVSSLTQKEQQYNTAFQGQMGAINFFSESLPKQRMQSIFALGPSYFYGFEAFSKEYDDVRKWIKQHPSDLIDSAFDGHLNSLLMLAYNPVVVNADTILDNTPLKNGIHWKGSKFSTEPNANHSMHAFRLPGTNLSSTNDVRLALDALGGAKALLPIFTQLDQSRTVTPQVEGQLPVVHYDADVNLSLSLIQFVQIVLENSIEAERAGQNNIVFDMLELFLSNISHQHLRSDMLNLLMRIYDDQRMCPSIQNALLENVFCYFKIWKYTSFQVQSDLIVWLSRLRNYDGKLRVAEALGFQKLLEHMYLCYEYVPDFQGLDQMHDKPSSSTSTTSSSTNSLFDSHLPILTPRASSFSKLEQQRMEFLSEADLKRLRGQLFGVFYETLRELPNTIIEDIQLLLSYILDVKSQQSKCEGLSLLFDLLDWTKNAMLAQLTLRCLSIDKGMLCILSLTNSNMEKVRLKAILIFFKVVEVANTFRDLPPAPISGGTTSPSNMSSKVVASEDTFFGGDIEFEVDLPSTDHSQNNNSTNTTTGSSNIINDSKASTSTKQAQNRPSSQSNDNILVSTNASFDLLGLSLDKLPMIISSIQKSFLAFVRAQSLEKSGSSGSTISRQCDIAVMMFELTLYGDPLVKDLDVVIDALDLDIADKIIETLVNSLVDISEMKICVPMVFAALIQLIADKLMSPLMCLSIVCHLKACLSSIANAETILRLPGWQAHLFHLIIFEHKFMSDNTKQLSRLSPFQEAEQRSIEKNIAKSQAILDACLRIMCDIHVVAVRIGKPIGIAPIARKKDYTRSSNPIDSLREMGRGERQLGVTVLRDTIACLRIYGEKGDLDIQRTGYALLLQTFSVLERELEMSVRTFADKFLDQSGYFERTFYLNVWLVASLVLDFITVPTIQGRKGDGSEPARIASSANLSQLNLREPTPKQRERKRMISFEKTAVAPLPSDVAADDWLLGDIAPSQEALTELSDMFVDITRDETSFQSSSFTRLDVNHGSALLNQRMDDPNDKELIWQLLDRLMNLLDTLALEEVSFLQATTQIGLLTGRSLMKNINDEIGDIVQPLSPSDKKLQQFFQSKNISQKFNFPKTPLSNATGGVCWILIRVMLSMLLSSVSTSHSTQSTSISNDCLTILERLKKLLKYSEERNVDFCTFESFHIVTKLSEELKSVKPTNENKMVLRSLVEFILDVVKVHRDVFVELIQQFRKDHGVVDDLEDERKHRVKSTDSGSGTPQGNNTNHNKQRVVVIAGGRGMMPSSYVKNQNSYQGDALVTECLAKFDTWLEKFFKEAPSSNRSMSEILLKVLNKTLQIHNMEVTWTSWSQLTGIVSEEAKHMEDESLRMKLTELGLHKHSQEIKQQMQKLTLQESRFCDELKYRSIKVANAVQSLFQQKVSFSLRLLQIRERKNFSKWQVVFNDLANERGCWSYSADPNCRVFWMLDPVENAQRQRPRLRRNEHGTNHQVASRLSGGCNKSSSSENLLENSDSISIANSSSSGVPSQGIWKDLVKYKKVSFASTKLKQQNRMSVGNTSGANTTIGSEEDNDDSFLDQDDEDLLPENNVEALAIGAEQCLVKLNCEVITVSSNALAGRTPGVIEISKSKLVFTKSSDSESFEFKNTTANEEFTWVCSSFPSTTWNTIDIEKIFGRHYLWQFSAIEFFFTSRTSVFVNLFTSDAARELFKCVVSRVKPPLLPSYVVPSYRHPERAIQSTLFPGSTMTLTQAWVNRKISNFEYLMKLNTIAGRSFNDVGQYPVFPWIIRDYDSTKLDLRNPDTFRDLKWPVGAQTQAQRDVCHQRYCDGTEMQDIEFPPFHHGTHYSCMGFVFWFLIRMEPFTSLGIWLQDGKFDHSDRLFYSVPAAWKGTTSNHNDAKELIPEFFYFPEFLENVNEIDLGTMQSGKKIEKVELPTWCQDANDFIRQNREALESEYVSENLHHWIDLIFGHKQRPPSRASKGSTAAIDAFNVFFHLTYMDAVNLTEIKATDDALYQRLIRQIDNYGQTPCQLFTNPHPQRLPLSQTKIIWPIASCVSGVDTIMREEDFPKMPSGIVCFQEEKVSSGPVIFLTTSVKQNRLLTIDISRVLGLHQFVVKEPDVVPPYTIKIDVHALKISTAFTSTSNVQESSTFLSRMSLSGMSLTQQRDCIIGVPFSPTGLLSRSSHYYYNLDRFDPRMIGTPDNKRKFELMEEEKSGTKKVSSRQSIQSKRFSEPVKVAAVNQSVDIDTSVSLSGDKRQTSMTMEISPDEQPLRFPSPPEVSTESQGGNNYVTPKVSARKRHDRPSTKGTKEFAQGKQYDLGSHLFALLPDQKLLFSCGHWDYSFKVTFTETGKMLQSITAHSEVVTCIALAEDFGRHWLVTGSKDCTVMVWEVIADRLTAPVTSAPLHLLFGHDDSVTCVAVNAELDVVVSGSDDGTFIIHSLRQGLFLHSIVAGLSTEIKQLTSSVSIGDLATVNSSANNTNNKNTPTTTSAIGSSSSNNNNNTKPSLLLQTTQTIRMICISKIPYIVIYSSDGRNHRLLTYSINGKLLSSIDTEERLFCMCLSEDGKVIVTGGERCLVVFRWVHNLTIANDGPKNGLPSVLDGSSCLQDFTQGPFMSSIRSLHLTPRESHLIVGLDSGHIRILAQDSEYLRKRLIHNLEDIGLISYGGREKELL